jgi:hypothetical protein
MLVNVAAPRTFDGMYHTLGPVRQGVHERPAETNSIGS